MNANAANFDPSAEPFCSPSIDGQFRNEENQNLSSGYDYEKEYQYEQYDQYSSHCFAENIPNTNDGMGQMNNVGNANFNDLYVQHDNGNLYYDTVIHEPQTVGHIPIPETIPPYGNITQPYYEEFRFFSPNTPISQINIDTNHEELIYVSSHVVSQSTLYNINKKDKFSYLAAHFLKDGGTYSAVAAHPDSMSIFPDQHNAMKSTLGRTNKSLHSNSSNITANNSNHPSTHIHSHLHSQSHYTPPESFGIGSLFHFPKIQVNNINDSNACEESIIGSISPYGIRLHSQGGLLLTEFPFALASSHSNGNPRNSFRNQSISFEPWETCCGCLHSTPNYNSPHVSATGTMPMRSRNGLKDSVATNKKIASHKSSLSSNISACHQQTNIYTYDFNMGNCTSVHTLESGVTDIKASSWNQTLVTGCEDGYIRFFDTRILGKQQPRIVASFGNQNGSSVRGGLTTVAQVLGQKGGIAQIALSDNGYTFCSTGYNFNTPSSLSNHSFQYPSNEILQFDTRYLGRGGISHVFHSNNNFTGDGRQILNNDGPRFLKFIPNHPKTLFLASGQANGRMKILNLDAHDPTCEEYESTFIDIALENGEKVMDIDIEKKGDVWVGTNYGSVIKMKQNEKCWDNQVTLHAENRFLSGTSPYSSAYDNMKTTTENTESLDPDKMSCLEIPPYTPLPPAITVDSKTIQVNIDNIQSFPINPFQQYTLLSYPQLSFSQNNYDSVINHDTLQRRTMIAAPRRILSKTLSDLLVETDVHDFVAYVSCSSLGLKSLDASTFGDRSNKRGKQNPNKLLYSMTCSSKCYNLYADPRKKRPNRYHMDRGDDEMSMELAPRDGRGSFGAESSPAKSTGSRDFYSITQIPTCYRRMIRPPNTPEFNYEQFNSTQLWPGWDDYGGNMPNAYAAPLVVILYFTPEVRNTFLKKQFDQKLWEKYEFGSLSVELGFLFHQIYQRSIHALTHPNQVQVGVFNPSSFLSALALLPEASALALLDGTSAVASDECLPRRLEAFWRFLVHHLDSEIGGSNRNENGNKLMNKLFGMDFVNINEFINGSSPPSEMNTRSLTVELCYDVFVSKITRLPNSTVHTASLTQTSPSFGAILLHSLCKETRLRAWSKETKKFATVVQRKIASSLPKILAITCAGKKGENKDLVKLWRKGGKRWLPEEIEIEIRNDGSGSNVTVKEYIDGKWHNHEGGENPTKKQSETSQSEANTNKKLGGKILQRIKYKLVAIVSYIRSTEESIDNDDYNDTSSQSDGNHVVHARIPIRYERNLMTQQKEKASLSAMDAKNLEDCLAKMKDMNYDCQDNDLPPLTQSSQIPSSQVIHLASSLEKKIDNRTKNNDWILMNGFAVKNTNIADACDFSLKFREPCMVFYRDVQDMTDFGMDSVNEKEETMNDSTLSTKIPTNVMETPSLTGSPLPKYVTQDLPGKGDIIAIDAEFVLVQHEESILNANGSKVTVNEGRHALARVSVIDCRSGNVIVDDYVLPHEPVVDYLTRFSGIHPNDLDRVNSPHHLVTMRSAYLKLRLLLDRGCIFLGHGLDLDFRMLNIFVPPSQIIDTVIIFRKNRSRMISLRFLANYLLGYDMQQDTHDSIEDAKTAYELYLKALLLKSTGKFDQTLSEIYKFGQKNDWKIGGISTEPI